MRARVHMHMHAHAHVEKIAKQESAESNLFVAKPMLLACVRSAWDECAWMRSYPDALLVESVGVHRLVLGGPLQKGAAAADAALQADMRNVTASFGGWLLEQGFEAGLDEAEAAGGAHARHVPRRAPLA